VAARRLLDEAGMSQTRIAASGDLEERRIAELIAAGAPVDLWGIGTDLGTSRDSPVVNGVYKLVADRRGESWRGVWKHSPDKETVPGAKQVFRRYDGDSMSSDVIAAIDENLEGEPLLVPAMREGEPVRHEPLPQIRERSAAQLAALPEGLRRLRGSESIEPYPVSYSKRLRASIAER
jgi:nicotinate phosphoribosyltransferase